MTGVRTGQCLCGAVKYQVRGALDGAIGCHCGQCRRTSGHYTAGALVRRDGVTLTEDRGLKWYQSSPEARRGFCAECGSSVLWDYVAGDAMGIFLGSLGVHRFYLGYTGVGLIMLLLTLCGGTATLFCVPGAGCGLIGIWGFIEGIVCLTGGMRDADGLELQS